MKTAPLILATILAAASLATAAPTQKTTCVDPALSATIATWPNLTSAYGIYGDGVTKDSSGNSVYTDGAQNSYVKFQVCNGTNDFIMNLSPTRGFWYNFGHNVATCSGSGCTTQPTWTNTPQTATSGFINANEVYTAKVGSTINTWMAGPGAFTVGKTSYGVRMRNPWSLGYADSPNGALNVINMPYPTALVQVTHPDCNTWVLTAIPGPSCDPATCSTPGPAPFAFPVATLLMLGSKSDLNAGQYEMGFQMTLKLLIPVTSCN